MGRARELLGAAPCLKHATNVSFEMFPFDLLPQVQSNQFLNFLICIALIRFQSQILNKQINKQLNKQTNKLTQIN